MTRRLPSLCGYLMALAFVPGAVSAAGGAAAVKEVTFDTVKLELKKDDPFDRAVLTDKVKQLDGKPIRIRGYILPSFQQTGIKQFVLVRDNMECCFGPGALLHDCILVEMIAPATATFTVRPVSVEGVFSIREVKGPDGKHLAIYHLDGKQVNKLGRHGARVLATCLAVAVVARGAAGCPFCRPLTPTLCQARAAAAVTALVEVEAAESEDARAKLTRVKVHKVFDGKARLAERSHLTLPFDLAARPGMLLLIFGTGPMNAAAEALAWHAEAVDETSYAYFARAPAVGTPTAERLKYFIAYLEHPDALVAEDAYLEFAHASFADVSSVAGLLPIERIRGWLADPGVPPHRKGFYGLALGLARSPDERRTNAALLRKMIETPEDDFRAGFDGVLGGWLVLEGVAGLELVESRYLANPRAADGDVRHALTAIRFYQEYGRDVPEARLYAAVRQLLARPEFAEAATIDLARWQDWGALDEIAGLYTRPGYAQPAVRRAIVGYLLACPKPEAGAALKQLRKLDPRGVAEAEQVLSRTSSVPSNQ